VDGALRLNASNITERSTTKGELERRKGVEGYPGGEPTLVVASEKRTIILGP